MKRRGFLGLLSSIAVPFGFYRPKPPKPPPILVPPPIGFDSGAMSWQTFSNADAKANFQRIIQEILHPATLRIQSYYLERKRAELDGISKTDFASEWMKNYANALQVKKP